VKLKLPPPRGLAVLRVLLEHIATGKVIASRPETFIGYKDIHDALDLPLRAATYGDSLSRQGLADLAEWTLHEEHPAITGLVIDRSNYRPGKGYFELFRKRPEDFQWWTNEIARSLAYDWQPFVVRSAAVVEPKPTQRAADFQPPPPDRALTTDYRILRDTELARRVKSIHRYECQLCGHSIHLADGSRYAEAHHIRGLGEPHNGPDVIGNILCLCPNHHAELDYGVIQLVLSAVRLDDAHEVDVRFVEYHNRQIYKARAK
jgi:hypothetical protein